jgi:hypothetical protein
MATNPERTSNGFALVGNLILWLLRFKHGLSCAKLGRRGTPVASSTRKQKVGIRCSCAKSNSCSVIEPGQSKLKLFKEKVLDAVTCDNFTTPDDLGYKVASSLGRFLITRKVKEGLEHIPCQHRAGSRSGRRHQRRPADEGQDAHPVLVSRQHAPVGRRDRPADQTGHETHASVSVSPRLISSPRQFLSILDTFYEIHDDVRQPSVRRRRSS